MFSDAERSGRGLPTEAEWARRRQLFGWLEQPFSLWPFQPFGGFPQTVLPFMGKPLPLQNHSIKPLIPFNLLGSLEFFLSLITDIR